MRWARCSGYFAGPRCHAANSPTTAGKGRIASCSKRFVLTTKRVSPARMRRPNLTNTCIRGRESVSDIVRAETSELMCCLLPRPRAPETSVGNQPICQRKLGLDWMNKSLFARSCRLLRTSRMAELSPYSATRRKTPHNEGNAREISD